MAKTTKQMKMEKQVAKYEEDILDATRRFAGDLAKQIGHMVPASEGAADDLTEELTRLIEQVFDFTGKLMEGQRKLVFDLVRAVTDSGAQVRTRARVAARSAAKPRAASARAPARRAVGRSAPAARPGARKAAARRPAAKSAA